MYDEIAKTKADMPTSNILKKYNHMGGIVLYVYFIVPTPMKSRSYLLGQPVMSEINAWLLYRRDTRKLGNGKPKPLCVFRSGMPFLYPMLEEYLIEEAHLEKHKK